MRLFVAVRPPVHIVAALATLPRPARRGVRWTASDQWHVTLRFLGDVADPAPILGALATAPIRPATATLGPAVEPIGRGVAAVPVAGLDELAAAVIGATAHLGQPPGDRPFRAHVTIARAKHDSLRDVLGTPIAARWTVDELHLVRSRLHPDGARYEMLASFTT